jgi:DNA-binding transcriptional MerR regulator
MTKKLLWSWEVAREVGVSARTVCRLADAGRVPCIRDSQGRRRFRPEAVDILRGKLGLREHANAAEGLA